MTTKLVEGFSSTGWPEKAKLESDEPMMPSKMSGTTSLSIVNHMDSMFVRHRIHTSQAVQNIRESMAELLIGRKL